ncbi:hypothetical protein ACJJTC_001089 [Scirpophaga incertulas]
MKHLSSGQLTDAQSGRRTERRPLVSNCRTTAAAALLGNEPTRPAASARRCPVIYRRGDDGDGPNAAATLTDSAAPRYDTSDALSAIACTPIPHGIRSAYTPHDSASLRAWYQNTTCSLFLVLQMRSRSPGTSTIPILSTPIQQKTVLEALSVQVSRIRSTYLLSFPLVPDPGANPRIRGSG